MFSELTVMNSERHFSVDPHRLDTNVFRHGRELFRERAQYIAVFPHDLFSRFHLGVKAGVGGDKTITVRRIGQIDGIAQPNAQACKHLLRED